MDKNDSDHVLIERAREGDKKAFELLMLKYRQRVHHLLVCVLHNAEDVLDVSQEVFTRAYQALPSFRGDSAFYTWLYRIALNSARNHMAAQARRAAVSMGDVEEQFAGNEHLRDNASPENLLMRDELQRAIYEAFMLLSEDMRTSIMLREVEGLSYDEIATVMGCPIGTVRSRIFRARETIEKRLQPLLGNEDEGYRWRR